MLWTRRRSRWTRSEPRLQRTQNVLRDEAAKSGIGIARMAAITDGTVNGDESMPALQVSDKRIALTSDSPAFHEGFGGGSHAHAKRYGHGAVTQPFLLSAAVDQGLYSFLEIAANVQRSDALRSIHLVSREADQICLDSQIAHVHGARSLRRIAVQRNAVGRKHFCDPRNVLNRSNFVVHRHYGNDQNAPVQSSSQHVQIDETFAVHRNRLNLEFFTRGKRPGGSQDAFVLNGAHEDTSPSVRCAPR